MTAPNAAARNARHAVRRAELAPRRTRRPGRQHPQGAGALRRRPAHRRVQDLTREDGEHLAAVASGFHSLAKGVGRHFEAGQVRQTVVELDEAFLFVTAAGDGSCLAVLADADSDVGQIAYEMTLLVKRVGAHLGTAPAAPVGAAGAAE